MAGSDNLGSSAQLPIQKLISDRCQVLGSVLTLFVVVASKTRRKDTGNSMLYLPVILIRPEVWLLGFLRRWKFQPMW